MPNVLLVLLLSLILPLNAVAVTAQEKGLQIAQEADKRDLGWGSQRAKMTMTLRNKQGDQTIREIRIRTLEVENDGDKSLTIFDTPADVKGTAFLSHTHAIRPDDQWLFLPALKRIKRISSSNKSGPFMGSEFAYEDISSQEVEKYSYKYLRDEEVNGQAAFVIERIPQYKSSGYKRQIAWIDQTMYQPVRIDFYDRKNQLLKTLTFLQYKQYLDQYWRSNQMEMNNHQTGKSTTLTWLDYQFKTGLKARDFDKNSLKRAR